MEHFVSLEHFFFKDHFLSQLFLGDSFRINSPKAREALTSKTWEIIKYKKGQTAASPADAQNVTKRKQHAKSKACWQISLLGDGLQEPTQKIIQQTKFARAHLDNMT